MTKEKYIDAGKQSDKPQDKFDKEHLTNEQLDNVAGGFNMPEPIPPEPIIYAETMGK